MSFFTAVLARHGRGWRVLDLDVDDAEDLDDLAELVRGSLPGPGPALAIIEREDAWFALVRVDEDGEPRPFVSDLRESLRSRYSTILEASADVDIPEELDGLGDADVTDLQGDSVADGYDEVATAPSTANDDDDDGSLDGDEPDDETASRPTALAAGDDLDEDDPLRATRAWAGDPALLDDLGLTASELVQLAVEEADDPAAALAGIGEAVGFDEQLDALR